MGEETEPSQNFVHADKKSENAMKWLDPGNSTRPLWIRLCL